MSIKIPDDSGTPERFTAKERDLIHRKFMGVPPADARHDVVRLFQALVVWVLLFGSGLVVAFAVTAEVAWSPAEAKPGWFGSYQKETLVGGGLMLLGLGLGGGISVRFWRRQQLVRDQLRARIVEIEAEVEHQRWNAEVLQASDQRLRVQVQQLQETLRASEARSRSFFELPLVGIGLTDPDKRWWEVNDCLCEMLGYQRAQLLRLSWLELTYPDNRATDLVLHLL